MAVSTDLNKHIYVGNGTNKTWSVGFRLLQATDLKLYLTNITTDAVSQITTNYSISPTGGSFPADTCSVTYPISGSAITSDYKLTLVRQVDITQTTVYPTNTALKPKVVEKDLDKSVMIDQQLNETLSRCIKTPISDEGTLDTDEYLTQVLTAKSAAETAKTNAETAETNAEAAATNAAASATEAANILSSKTTETTLFDYSKSPNFSDVIVKNTKIDIRSASGVDSTGLTDSSAGLASIFNTGGSSPGLEIWAPKGIYRLDNPVQIKNFTTFKGAGDNQTIFNINHNGKGFYTSNPVNSSTDCSVLLEDIKIQCVNPGNSLDAGFADIGGTFVKLHRVFINGFKYCVVFDQTEISSISACRLESINPSSTLLWLVNGDGDYASGTNRGFTNNITVEKTQFNSASGAVNIVDDGGGTHNIINNNFNAGVYAIRVAGVSNLLFMGNESEGHTGYPVYLHRNKLSGTYVGANINPIIEGNSITDLGANYPIAVNAVIGGRIKNNTLAQMTTAMILLDGGVNCICPGLEFGNNHFILQGNGRTSVGYWDGYTVAYNQLIDTQKPESYSVNGITAGSGVVVTPAKMDKIAVNDKLYCVNTDGTNGEIVTVTAITSTTFTATFTSNKSANFVMYGL